MLSWQRPVIHSWTKNKSLVCCFAFHCECQELKPKVQSSSSFLGLHLSLRVDTVGTVGSHLKNYSYCWPECINYPVLDTCVKTIFPFLLHTPTAVAYIKSAQNLCFSTIPQEKYDWILNMQLLEKVSNTWERCLFVEG